MRETADEERATRAASSAAQDAVRTAERTLGDIAAQIERVGERRADLDRRAAEIDADLTLARKSSEAEAAHAALPAGDAANADVTLRKQASEECRSAVSRLQADQAMTDRAIAADEERLRAVKGGRGLARAGRRCDTPDHRDAAPCRNARGRPRAAHAENRRRLPPNSRRCLAAHAVSTPPPRPLGSASVKPRTRLTEAEKALAAANEALSANREARAGAAARAEHAVARRREIGQACGERFECPPPVLPAKLGFAEDAVHDAASEQATHDRLVLERERLGPVNLVAATELAELEKRRRRAVPKAKSWPQRSTSCAVRSATSIAKDACACWRPSRP